MKKTMYISVVTEVDHSKMPDQTVYEKALQEAIATAIKSVLGTPKKATSVDFEYGDPV